MLYLPMQNLNDGDIISACISKDAFMKAAPDKCRRNNDCPESATPEWNDTDYSRSNQEM